MRSPGTVATTAAVVVVVATALVAVVSLTARTSPGNTAPGGSTTFGLLAPTDDQLDALTGTGLDVVMIGTAWSTLQPTSDTLEADRVTALVDRMRAAEARGLGVVLDLGLQYPPRWVFDLPGATRFVNQYGETWHGSLSQDVPNAVFNPAVRAAEARYVSQLGQALRSVPLAGVRVGGLLSGELRYPPRRTADHDDALWAFDAGALASSPDPSWRPGTGTASAARAVLTWYLDRMTAYLAFQLDTIAAALPGVPRQVLLPSWGLRPGMMDQAVATRFGADTPSDVVDLITAGLDWTSQIALLAEQPSGIVVYTTWLDAPDNGETRRAESPVAYLASLTAGTGLALGGENTGGGGVTAWRRTVGQAQRFGLSTVMFMSGDLLASGQAGLSLPDLLATVRPADTPS